MYIVLKKFKVRFLLFVLFASLFFLFRVAPMHAQEEDDMTYFNNEELDFLLGEKNRPWNYPTLSFAMGYFVIDGVLQPYMPYQTGFILAIDQGIHHFLNLFIKKSPP